MSKLDDLRKQIDECDAELIKLIEKRLDIAKQVAEFKLANDLPILDVTRETELLKKRQDMAQNKDYTEQVHDFFRYVMYLSRSVQGDMFLGEVNSDLDFGGFLPADESIIHGATVAYQGCEGSYGHQALKGFFNGTNASEIAFESFSDVFEAVSSGKVDFGVLPIENSSVGIVSDVYDLLVKNNCFIAGEQVVEIKHCLLGVKGANRDDIREVYSHPQAISQCGDYLSVNRQWKVNEYSNTAAAARFVSQSGDKTNAAIASEICAELYGLEIIEKGINFKEINSTRFAIISKKPVIMPKADKISLSFAATHRSGALYEILKHFAYNFINMLSIESRPVRNKNWEYIFFANIEGSLYDENVLRALKGVQEGSSSMRILGCYKKSE